MSRDDEKIWLKEFQAFVQGDEAPPEPARRAVLSLVHAALNPSFGRVFLKLGLVQLAASLVTFLFCPQLGIGTVFGNHGLMAVFMRFGPALCAAGCGAVFLGTSLALASLALRPEELRRIHQKHLIGIPLLSAVSLMLLMVAGGSGGSAIYLMWFAGAVVGGELGAQIVYTARMKRIAA